MTSSNLAFFLPYHHTITTNLCRSILPHLDFKDGNLLEKETLKQLQNKSFLTENI